MYTKDYFEEEIFSYDYDIIANIINESYHPTKVIDFGCGPGHLSVSLAKLGIDVLAVDGYSEPNFEALKNINFRKINFNKLNDVKLTEKFDVAICLEVAEHLNPESSENLINLLTKLSPIVVFSAAVPNQGGEGHINCQPRLFWYKLFIKNKFHIIDSIREKLRSVKDVADWYKLNVIDYKKGELDNFESNLVIKLLNADSYATSKLWEKQSEIERMNYKLNLPAIKFFLTFRNYIKKLIGRPPLK